MIAPMRNAAVSHHKLTLVVSNAAPARAHEQYPRRAVAWFTLAFCLSAWGVVIFGVTQAVA